MKNIKLFERDLPNPLHGNYFELASRYIIDPFRLRDENNGKRGEKYCRYDLIQAVVNSEGKVLFSGQNVLTVLYDQYKEYEFDADCNYHFVVVYEKERRLKEKDYEPIISLPLSVALIFLKYVELDHPKR